MSFSEKNMHLIKQCVCSLCKEEQYCIKAKGNDFWGNLSVCETCMHDTIETYKANQRLLKYENQQSLRNFRVQDEVNVKHQSRQLKV